MKYLLKPLFAVALVLATFAVLAFSMVRQSTQPKSQPKLPGYSLERPDKSDELADILIEVSGLTDVDDRTLACVQDELGVVFFYGLEERRIVRELPFSDVGDYEGITRVGDRLYALRSDGKLFEIDDFAGEDFHVTTYDTGIPVKNSEGLAYDPAHHRLLIAGKSRPKDDRYKEAKVVYAFDLDTKEVAPDPVLAFTASAIGRALKAETGQWDGDASINPSAIAVHPLTDDIYVLSSKDHLLYVFDRTEEVKGIYPLSERRFEQPEGITFLDDGTMFISNEGKNGAPTLYRFDYAQAK
ncbi:SdiA-regulated domain-containing protein [Lewinella sp. IMCC34183]|uniref:SdiA-regulated domain-containing protein n=1 Tax=Lewinella sp. IMCC34183 TaxID=2248762 RepID=UPI001300A37A|nr:SdiA-regulated domain-containing protein [Lewinella sp. IMCC34183]